MARHASLFLIPLFATAGSGCAGHRAELRAAKLGAEEEGMATYYSPRLVGHRTASGERYDPARFTAAHPTLPFGSLVEIARMDGGHRTVVVRINDRCTGERKIIDLSEAAARQLDMLRAGQVLVRLRVTGTGPP